MRTSKNWMVLTLITTFVLIFSTFSTAVNAAPMKQVTMDTFTILHTNDFHGQLQNKVGSTSNPGLSRVAKYFNDTRTAVGAAKVLVVDAGDEMQGSLLSNMYKGEATIGAFNAAGYDLATFGNHEFDWGQTVLSDRTTQADYDYVTANIVVNDTGNCATAGWDTPAFAAEPWEILEVPLNFKTAKVAFIGVTTTEVPNITIASATAGLCFKDPYESILHYYGDITAAGADVIVVLSHLGFEDGGYGYGIPVIGDKTLAKKLNDAGKPVNLIIGGHSHSNLTAATTVGNTKVVQAYYNGRKVGRADISLDSTGLVNITWASISISPTATTFDAAVEAVINTYASDPVYLATINAPVGYSAVDLARSTTADNMMATFIDDAIYKYLNTDTETANDIDLFFNNAGGIRTDLCYAAGVWNSTGCVTTTHEAGLLTYGNMYTILPFGNATAVGTMTGAQILEVVNNGPNVTNGVIQPAGLKYKYYKYTDSNPGPQPYAWGAFDVQVYDKDLALWVDLDVSKTYKVGTNEFLAPAGGDGYAAFKYMKNITYWGDMLNAVNAYVTAHYTLANPYMGPLGTGALDGRITQDSSIVPVTILHHNDSHGNLVKGTYVGYTQLVTLINQERLHNPNGTLLLSGGDNIQGDAMMYYFKSAGLGYAADGTVLDASMQMNPLIKAFNSMNYDAMTLGNHEFNFGSTIFKTLAQATFPILGANVSESPVDAYGLDTVGVEPYVEKTLLNGVKVAILGITNHRVPNYELPSNIPGLTFTDPIAKAQELSTDLAPTNDAVIALTHIGFTENPTSVEVDANVDTNLAMTTNGIDAIIGSHSHTNPATGFGDYKYLPSIVPNVDGDPVIINHAYRYNNTLGEVILGMRAKSGGGYEVVSQTGRYITVTTGTVENPAIVAIVAPYVAAITTYNNTVIGQTTVPIDTLAAFTSETNGANLQADASLYELEEKNSIEVDFHLSGAMTNKLIATGATPASPVTLKISDMFAAMPYENSLVVISMNGPQLKAVLERAYRNYYYYKYVSGYGGYSYYTTCMIDTDAGNVIKYNDLGPVGYDPTRQYVVSLTIQGVPIDFSDADTYYKVSTVNYLAAGSCNFNDAGVSLWPLDQIANDTQFYVRDAVIDYITHEGTVSPAIEGRLAFISDDEAPTITITSPVVKDYPPTGSLTLDFSAVDVGVSGLKSVWADLDGTAVTDGQVIDLATLSNGLHTLTVYAVDNAYNLNVKNRTFGVKTVPATPKLPGLVTTMSNPKFIWTAVPDQTKYEIQLYTSAGTLVKDWVITSPNCNATTCSFTPGTPLALVNGAYKWRVRSFNEVWSNYSYFKNFNKLDPPAPISPTGTISVMNPKFTWVKIPGATKYLIELKRTSGVIVRVMEVTTLDCDATTCSYRAPVTLNLLAHEAFMWRVRAFHGYYGPYSAYMHFTR